MANLATSGTRRDASELSVSAAAMVAAAHTQRSQKQQWGTNGMTNDAGPIPDFLNRKINPYKEPSKLALAICSLSLEQAELVWRKMQEKNPKFKPPKGTIYPKQLLHALAEAKAGQADVILSVIRDQSMVANQTIEHMMGKPITKLAEKTKNSWKTGGVSSSKPAKSRGSVAYEDTDIIKVLVPNPKKKGGDPWKRFELYKDGQTVREALTAGVLPADVAWDFKHKFISLEKPA